MEGLLGRGYYSGVAKEGLLGSGSVASDVC